MTARRRTGSAKADAQALTSQARSFAELLEQAVREYQSRAIETAQVIEELIGLAKDMRPAERRGEDLGLSEDELAETVRKNVAIDWTVRDNVRAHLRVSVKGILRKDGYPPDRQEKATQTVLDQAKALSAEWAV